MNKYNQIMEYVKKKKKVFIIILYFYIILYDTCILLCHIYIYQKNNIGTARMGHLHNPYRIRIIKLTREHPSSRCRFSFELTQDIQNYVIVPMVLHHLV